MSYPIMAILIMAAFYGFYFAKLIIQKQQSIKTNQMGLGNKPKKVLLIERITYCSTILAFIFNFPPKESGWPELRSESPA